MVPSSGVQRVHVCLVRLQRSAELLCRKAVGKSLLALSFSEVLKHMINLVVNRSSHRLKLQGYVRPGRIKAVVTIY